MRPQQTSGIQPIYLHVPEIEQDEDLVPIKLENPAPNATDGKKLEPTSTLKVDNNNKQAPSGKKKEKKWFL